MSIFRFRLLFVRMDLALKISSGMFRGIKPIPAVNCDRILLIYRGVCVDIFAKGCRFCRNSGKNSRPCMLYISSLGVRVIDL